MKKLYKSKNRILSGVCAGLGEYYDIDPTVVRILALVGLFVTGFFPGVFLYIIAIYIIPDSPQ